MDRNEKARAEFAAKQFENGVRDGKITIHDRFGNPLQVGSLAVWHPPYDLVWQVKEITPSLDPNQPPAIKVSLIAEVPAQFRAGIKAMDLIVVNTPIPHEEPQEPGQEPSQ